MSVGGAGPPLPLSVAVVDCLPRAGAEVQAGHRQGPGYPGRQSICYTASRHQPSFHPPGFAMDSFFEIVHHGAVSGVTGSCHELRLVDGPGLLVDCGLFQGAETSGTGASAGRLEIDFPLAHIQALVVSHVHIDHVGRIPWLLAAGFKGPILCTQPSARLLPLVLEDVVKIGITRDPRTVDRFIKAIAARVVAIPYRHWYPVIEDDEGSIAIKFQPAGHILGSAYVECEVAADSAAADNGNRTRAGAKRRHRVLFSGDLGPIASHHPALHSPFSLLLYTL